MDTTLKHRLIGAAVLVALAVIFLPMLVQGPAPDSGVADISMHVPDAPAGEYQTRELPLLAPASGASGALPPVAVSAQGEASAAATTDEAQAVRPDPAVAAGQWAVSFGAYASAKDADAVLARLRQAGLQGFSQTTMLKGNKAWRVRVGPYPDRALAEAGRLQAIRIRNDVNAQVIALDAGEGPAAAPDKDVATAPAAAQTPAAPAAVPERVVTRASTAAPPPASPKAPTASAASTAPAAPPAPPSRPAASSVGFAVQMGAFASTADANALRDRLREAGFSTIVQPVRTDKGLLNRVRVGPVASRAEAEQAKARLAAGGFGAGMVVAHP